MKQENNDLLHFNKIIFQKSFRFLFILVVCIIIVFSIIVDVLLVSNKKQKNITNTETAINHISKNISLTSSLTETIANDEHLKLLLRNFTNGSQIERLKTAKDISVLLDNYQLSSPEISHIAMYTTLSFETHHNFIYPLEAFIGTPWYDCFQNDGIIMFEDFSWRSRMNSDALDKELISIICPIYDNSFSHKWYVCTSISKDYLYYQHLNTSNQFDQYYLLNNKGEILLSHDLSLLGKVFPESSIAHLVQSKESNSKTLTYNNQRYLVSCSQTNDFGWKVVHLNPISQAISWRNTIVVVVLILILLLTFVVYALSNSLATQFATPLSALTDAMCFAKPIACDNMNIYEISELYNVYNKLLQDNDTLQKKSFDAELRALISQINPHFLYNTLHIIAYKALDANQSEICTIIGKLGKLCQHNYKFSTTHCTLRDEIAAITLYMDLQKLCFKNSFNYTIEIDDQYLDIIIPKFILQPIIENCIIHGFSQSPQNGHITISVSMNSNLIITVKDNGIGIVPEILEKLNNGTYISEKYGIDNINKRIKLLFGDEYGINFSSHSCIGTTATIAIPINCQKEL